MTVRSLVNTGNQKVGWRKRNKERVKIDRKGITDESCGPQFFVVQIQTAQGATEILT